MVARATAVQADPAAALETWEANGAQAAPMAPMATADTAVPVREPPPESLENQQVTYMLEEAEV